MDNHDYDRILRNWGVAPGAAPKEVDLPGSPERTISRAAVADGGGHVWVLEKIQESGYTRKREIAETIEFLEGRGLQALHPYKRNSLGQFITCCAGSLYMIRPYVSGVMLDRDTWLNESWRGAAMADFLIEMRLLSSQLPEKATNQAFSIFDFIQRRTEAYQKFRPDLAAGLAPVIQGLEKTLFPQRGSLRAAFCHGDYHPMNVIWGKRNIQSVIDWEFCGTKPEAYDAALLVGCIGFDDPDALIDDFTIRIIHRLRDAGIYDPASWDIFFDLVIAIRYGWLSEWMRKSDETARDMEMLYMNLLTTQKRYILGKWGF